MAATETVPASPPLRASLDAPDRITLLYATPPESVPGPDDFSVQPGGPVTQARRAGRRRLALLGGPFEMTRALFLTVRGTNRLPVLPGEIVNRLRTNEPLGLTWQGDHALVRLFHPRGRAVTIVVYEDAGSGPVAELPMAHSEATGCWTIETDALKPGRLYGFRVEVPDDAGELSGRVFCDPYGRAVAKSRSWPATMLTVALDGSLLDPPRLGHRRIEPRDLVIYEAHVKDVSALADDVPRELRGSFPGVTAGSFPDHLKRIGANTVEWLPLHVYEDREPPYGTHGNRWNETERNHWGYMSAQFFAPEPRYASGDRDGGWPGTDARANRELRRMVHELHEHGFAVLLDVVFNHVANYGNSPLRRLDPYYWLRHDGHGRVREASGCGNDFATERPMARRMIVDSLLHWTRVYGIDGFRFDLAGLIDDRTLDEITDAVRGENPDAHLIAEPWGGLYDKTRYSVRGWSAWNDHFRDGVRGHDPERHKGLLFGGEGGDLLEHAHGNVADRGGPFREEHHAVNYLACHDGYTYGDFIRIATGWTSAEATHQRGIVHELTDEITLRYRLGMFMLFTSRGIVMLHAGDEWARAKLTVAVESGGSRRGRKAQLPPGRLDRDSYNRDDETNWLRWSEAEREPNRALVEYVAGLAAIRRLHPALRYARHDNVHPLPGCKPRRLAYAVDVPGDRVVVLLNLDATQPARFRLSEETWVLIADERTSAGEPFGRGHAGEEELAPWTAKLLVPRAGTKVRLR